MKIKGMPVKDAKKSLVLTITTADVRTGKGKEPRTCAAARALCRQEHVPEAIVHLSRVYVRKGDQWLRYGTPQSMRSEIVAFDRGGTFETGTYTLPALQPSVRLGSPRKSPRILDGSKPQSGNRAKMHITKGVRQHGSVEWHR
jgi:hypothetical protein